MFALTFYLLSLLYLTLSVSEDEFIGIASTTQKPSEKQEIKELKSTINEIQYRLELLELKNKQLSVNENINSLVKQLEVLLESKTEVIYEKINKIQHTLEIESNAAEKKLNELHHKLDIFESKNEQNATDEKMSKILDKFETLDSKIKEIALKSNEQCATKEKLNEINHKLDIFESKNKQNATNKNISKIVGTLDPLDTKIEEIAQKLRAMNQVLPKNCREVQQLGHNVTKIYKIQPDSSPKPFEVLCDMGRRGGGWTYFLNRFDGSQDFDLTWKDYKIGFGEPSGEFWLGLENIHHLTGFKTNELLVELMDWDNKVVYAHYDAFSVGNESEGYSLKILGKYEGTAGDSCAENARMKFTTKDKDQDSRISNNCARLCGGGWWYKSCGNSYPTGKYYEENMLNNIPTDKGINWKTFHGFNYSLKQVKMMIKPQNN